MKTVSRESTQKEESPKNLVTEIRESARRRDIWRMFDRIAHRYDLLNRLLSFGQDVIWRKKVTNHLKDAPDQFILDLATGTADLLITVCQNSPQVTSGVGIDLAVKMLEIGERKIAEKNLDTALKLETGDATNIPFPDDTFDAVMIAFGIRNIEDVEKALFEMHRILKTEGRGIILEFSLPANPVVRSLYLLYFRKILPRVGAWISGDKYAYGYLNETVESFPYGKDFKKLMCSAGFVQVESTPLTFGIATIYHGDKV